MPQLDPSLPINDLSDFLDEVSKLFDNMVDSWSQILFKESDRTPIAEAWAEVKPSVHTIKDQLIGVGIAAKLREAGLAGKQLALKLKGLNDAWKSFWENGTVRLLKKLLDWINAILESLAIAVPPAEALKELKEAMENLIGE